MRLPTVHPSGAPAVESADHLALDSALDPPRSHTTPPRSHATINATINATMFRHAYLASLVTLQCALAFHVVPVLVAALARPVAYAAVHGGAAGGLLLALVALTTVGGAVALAFPVLALARHLRRGPWRFVGVPVAAAVAAIAGAAVVIGAHAVLAVAGSLPPDWRTLAVHGGRVAGTAGFALTAAGALAGELLRRSIGPLWLPVPRTRGSPSPEASPRHRRRAGSLAAT